MTYSFQIWWWIPHPGHPVHASHPSYPVWVIQSVLQGWVYHRFGIFLFPSRSRILGMLFLFPSRSRIMGGLFFIYFPFPNCGNGFFSFPSHSRICYFTDGNWITMRDTNFFGFLYISQNNYIEQVNWAKMFKSKWLKRQDILLSFVANRFAAKVLVIVNKIVCFFIFVHW